MNATPPKLKSEMQKAAQKLLQVIQDGMKHGFFEYTITCEMVNKRKRQLTIKAGKSHKFKIPEEELF